MKGDKTYLDYAATTPIDSCVMESMLPYFQDHFGNPSSIHRWGQKTEAAIEESRAKVASHLGCHPSEVVFTSSGSESDNLALRGTALQARKHRKANHILTSPVEHRAVLRTAQDLEQTYGFELEYLPVDRFGCVSPDELEKAIRSDTSVVSIIHANNEIGSINPIKMLSSVCRSKNIPFHIDSVQAASQLPLDVNHLGIDLMSIGAHKFYGPKGVGALYIRSGIELHPILTGGNQENGLRAGTQNVPLIVGMANALEITVLEREKHNRSFQHLRDQLLERIPDLIPDTQITGHTTWRLSNHASFVFKGIHGNHLLMALDIAGFACSSDSACKTGDPEPSDVLKAIGLSQEWTSGSLRVTVGRSTTQDDIDRFLEVLPTIIERIRRSND